MPPNAPRRDWHSSMMVPMYSLGVMIVHLTIGSLIDAILPAGQSDGLVTVCSAPSSILIVVDDVRRRGDQVQTELPFEPVAGDLQVQQPEIAAAVTESERRGGLRLVGQRGVVEPQLVQRVAQQRVVRPVQRVQPGVDHRPRLAVTAERDGGALGRRGDGVADLRLPDVLHPGDQVADLADPQADGRDGFGRDDADLEQFVDRPWWTSSGSARAG